MPGQAHGRVLKLPGTGDKLLKGCYISGRFGAVSTKTKTCRRRKVAAAHRARLVVHLFFHTSSISVAQETEAAAELKQKFAPASGFSSAGMSQKERTKFYLQEVNKTVWEVPTRYQNLSPVGSGAYGSVW